MYTIGLDYGTESGRALLVDTRDGSLLRDADAKERAAARHDYGLLADRVLVPVERHHIDVEAPDDIPAQQRLHGWGAEDVKFVVEAMAETGAEPVYSMGDYIPIAALGRTPRRIYGYLRQRFAQVTNPAIDPLREKAVMSLRMLLGARRGTLEPEGGADLGRRQAAAGQGTDSHRSHGDTAEGPGFPIESGFCGLVFAERQRGNDRHRLDR